MANLRKDCNQYAEQGHQSKLNQVNKVILAQDSLTKLATINKNTLIQTYQRNLIYY